MVDAIATLFLNPQLSRSHETDAFLVKGNHAQVEAYGNVIAQDARPQQRVPFCQIWIAGEPADSGQS